MAGDGAAAPPACKCGKPSNRLQSQKENANKGRFFFACATRSCNFFAWEGSAQAAAGGGRGGGGGGGSASSSQARPHAAMPPPGQRVLPFASQRSQGSQPSVPFAFPPTPPVTSASAITGASGGGRSSTGSMDLFRQGATRVTADFEVYNDADVLCVFSVLPAPSILAALRDFKPAGCCRPADSESSKEQASHTRWLVPNDRYRSVVVMLKELPDATVTVKGIPDYVWKLVERERAGQSRDKAAQTLAEMEARIPPTLFQKLRPFQRDGIQSAILKGGRVLIGDEMGLGKTVQALGLCSFFRPAWPVLIICPSSLRLTWAAEIQRWLELEPYRVQVLMTAKDVPDPFKEIVIVSYDLCSRAPLSGILTKTKYQIIVADECHYLKSRDAKRTKTIVPMIKASQYAIMLSGTPALSRPMELYTQVTALVKLAFPSMGQYGQRYCDAKMTHFGMDYSGSSHLGELYWFLEKCVMIRRLKKNVLKELPPKTRQCIYVDLGHGSKGGGKSLAQIGKQLAALGQDGGSGGLNDPRFMELYMMTGVAKIPAVIEYLRDVFHNTDKKFLVFAHHIEVLNALSKFVETDLKVGYIRIDGSTPAAQRQELCDRFQTREDVRVAVLGIVAAGVGLTLHRADLVIFAELFWTPAQLMQAEDRAHRLGRQSHVDIKYILAKGTLDDRQWPLIQSKLEVIGRAVDGCSESVNMNAERVEIDANGRGPGGPPSMLPPDQRRLTFGPTPPARRVGDDGDAPTRSSPSSGTLEKRRLSRSSVSASPPSPPLAETHAARHVAHGAPSLLSHAVPSASDRTAAAERLPKRVRGMDTASAPSSRRVSAQPAAAATPSSWPPSRSPRADAAAPTPATPRERVSPPATTPEGSTTPPGPPPLQDWRDISSLWAVDEGLDLPPLASATSASILMAPDAVAQGPGDPAAAARSLSPPRRGAPTAGADVVDAMGDGDALGDDAFPDFLDDPAVLAELDATLDAL